jgi:type IV pilus assembly protein PilZ
MGRRELLRIEAEIEIHFKNFEQFYKEYAKNISKGGIFIKSNNPLPPQTIIEIKIFLPDDKEPLDVVGEVVHIIEPEIAQQRGWDPGMGVHFVDYDEEMFKRLEKYIDSQADEKPQAKVDRRRHQRTTTRMKVKFPDLTTLLENYAKDISQGGIFIPTTDPKPVGVTITLTLVHPENGEEVEINGEVVRVVTEKEAKEHKDRKLVPGMGIKFVNLEHDQQLSLEQFLAVEYPLDSKTES